MVFINAAFIYMEAIYQPNAAGFENFLSIYFSVSKRLILIWLAPREPDDRVVAKVRANR